MSISSDDSIKDKIPVIDSGASNSSKQGIVRVKFSLYVEMCENNLQVENHMKRITNIRKELNYIKNTDWQYDPIEKYIGQA